MKRYFERLGIRGWGLGTWTPSLQSLVSSLFLMIIPILYIATLAQLLILGDPTEYTFIANILGIAHPPGYAFITLLGKLFQTLIPFGDIPWRMHLLSAASATLATLFVYGTVKTVISLQSPISNLQSPIIALFAALTVGTAVNFWQHAIHANPHIITATFLAANLYFLTKWALGEEGVKGRKGEGETGCPFTPSPLHLFAFSAGLGVTHHPLTVFGFPAYVWFILSVWRRQESVETGDRDWRLAIGDWRNNLQSPISNLIRLLRRNAHTLLKMAGFALLGLSVWLYYPLRSPHVPFGPTSMNTLNGFLDHVLARGLSESLPYFSLAEQGDRLIVFGSILRLQYSLPVILLAIWGIIWPFIPFTPSPLHPFAPSLRRLVTLYALTFASFYAFVISLRAQDIMAYILGPVLIVGLLAGIGLYGVLQMFNRKDAKGAKQGISSRFCGLILLVFFALGPVLQIVRNAPLVSLRDYDEGVVYVDAVFDQFSGSGAGAALLNDWEHMTPLWYAQFVEKRWPDPADVRPEFVSAAKPWVEFVFDYLPGGPVYLSNYRRDVVDAGFRLRPSGPFYQVVDPGDASIPPALTPVSAGDVVEVVGFGWEETAVTAGDYVPLTLALRTPTGTTDFYVPVLRLGGMTFPFTTDSHLTTPNWQPGEVIVERFDFALPHDLADGRYPVTLNLKNLSADEDVPLNLNLGQLTVTGLDDPIATDNLLANFRQRVGLVSATARGNGLGRRRSAPWSDPIAARPGDTIHLTLKWQALDYAEESYTILIHLIDPANRPIVALDYTPLGGAMPTHLWFPKWLPGQRMLDPYRLQIPPDLSPGTYLIEVGLYEMVGRRRLHIAAADGSLVGDRYILGSVVVAP